VGKEGNIKRLSIGEHRGDFHVVSLIAFRLILMEERIINGTLKSVFTIPAKLFHPRGDNLVMMLALLKLAA
jgi:hypothetical protein